MSSDRIETFGRSTLQHGPSNDRVYLMKLDRDDFPQVLEHIDALVARHGYSKAFAKVPVGVRSGFEKGGYRVEATIPGLYNGSTAGLFMSRYYHAERLIDHAADRVQQVLEKAREKAGSVPAPSCGEGLECRLATESDCGQMADLYRAVFPSYPFPIDDPAYLARTMAENVIYAGIWEEGRLLALASAEIDRAGENAEMTDFATRPELRGRGLAKQLLGTLEALMAEAGIKTCYTIARATSFGMNIVFSRHGYRFGGTLVKNTQISGGLESMNVWHKRLSREKS